MGICIQDSFPASWTRAFSPKILKESQAAADKAAERVKDAMRFCWRGFGLRGLLYRMGQINTIKEESRRKQCPNLGE